MAAIPDYSNRMTIPDFVDACKCGMFTDYDGCGYYATETEMTNQEIRPSDVLKKQYNPEYSHVVWFNR